MMYDKHASGKVKGVPHAVAVVEMSKDKAWGYIYSNPDTEAELRAKWEADRKTDTTPPHWSVLIGGVRDLVGTAGDHLIREGLQNFERQAAAEKS